MIVVLLAWSGALLSCLLSIPQAVQVLTTDRLDGVSAATYWIVLANATVWASWSILAAEYAAGVPSLVNGPAAVLILARLRRIRSAASRIGVRASAPVNLVDPPPFRPHIVRTLGSGQPAAGRMAAARPERSSSGRPAGILWVSQRPSGSAAAVVNHGVGPGHGGGSDWPPDG